MAITTVRINGRHYEVACDDGQEEHLRMLADEVDERMRLLLKAFGTHPGESTAFLLTSLMMADELYEHRRENHEISQEVQRLASIVNDDRRNEQYDRMQEMEQAMAVTLEEIAQRIETIADRVQID